MARALLICLLFLVACGAPPAEEAGEPAVRARSLPAVIETDEPDHSAFEKDARVATQRLQLELQQELADALAEGGPARALEVCSRRASELTAEVSATKGMDVRRVSLRHRNPQNRATTGEASVLAMMAAHPDLSDTTIVRDGQPFYMRAIRIGTPLCLQCHGTEDQLGEGVAERLGALYEDDLATGFGLGDLRGAFVVRPAR